MTARVAVLARYVAAAILGAASVLGFAPYRLAVIPLLALALLFLLWRGCASVRAAAVLGLIFGLGFFLTGTSWIYVSLHTFGGMPAVLTAIATFIFSAVVACYPALALGLAKRIARDDVSAPREARAMLIVLPACWTLGELLRGTLWTGFPWLGLGYSQVPGSP
ncbi:MAG: apolipoprotein N-acyltransferase, partial [Casimicrobiaceae bacterium]